jgi:hypothetical protein
MSHNARRSRERNAGAFMGPDIMVPVPMHTLDDDYDDAPVDPPEDAVPVPERSGLLQRLFRRAAGARRDRPPTR